MNSCILIGRLCKDPELKFVPATGMAVAKMSLAVDKDMFGEKKQQAVSQGKPTCDFINITVFGKSAENCANYLAKGRQCAIHGRINTSNYTDAEGKKHYNTDVIADKVEFIGSKDQGQAKPQQDSNHFGDFPDDEDIFQPVDDEEIPF